MNRPFLAALVVAACALAAAPAAAAEPYTGKITGVVVHAKSGKRLPGAIVVLQCTCLPEARETETDDNGLYVFRDLPPGTYAIEVLSGEADVARHVSPSADRRAHAPTGPSAAAALDPTCAGSPGSAPDAAPSRAGARVA